MSDVRPWSSEAFAEGGFVPSSALPTSAVPTAAGVYVMLRPSDHSADLLGIESGWPAQGEGPVGVA